ncbi:hypothetical protein NDU88_006393 [Pleurodeles waltl]|uniref:Uncharacterized protein n=1 Tax=Pleurodeles waltl TaxID=8319 RepID=A0AAV7N2W5_PLEWA|nr:hypothetical protein NDU88_006393 [Pleurodeles waltl]
MRVPQHLRGDPVGCRTPPPERDKSRMVVAADGTFTLENPEVTMESNQSLEEEDDGSQITASTTDTQEKQPRCSVSHTK